MRMQDINTGVNWGAEVIPERGFPTQEFFQTVKNRQRILDLLHMRTNCLSCAFEGIPNCCLLPAQGSDLLVTPVCDG